MPATPQSPFGGFDHDSLQYHFFCGDIVGACRLFRTNTLDHASVWVFKNGDLRQIATSDRILARDPKGLDADAGAVSFREADGRILVEAVDGASRFRVDLRPRREIAWGDTIDRVVHQPDIAVALELDDARFDGVGYCKRYSWTPAPRHWGYRFVQGFADGGETSIWTAEATFGLNKYDYFRILTADGSLIDAVAESSRHRQNAVFAETERGPFELTLEELAAWDAPLRSERMDSLLRQRVCRFEARHAGRALSGFAINETCYGTLG